MFDDETPTNDPLDDFGASLLAMAVQLPLPESTSGSETSDASIAGHTEDISEVWAKCFKQVQNNPLHVCVQLPSVWSENSFGFSLVLPVQKSSVPTFFFWSWVVSSNESQQQADLFNSHLFLAFERYSLDTCPAMRRLSITLYGSHISSSYNTVNETALRNSKIFPRHLQLL